MCSPALGNRSLVSVSINVSGWEAGGGRATKTHVLNEKPRRYAGYRLPPEGMAMGTASSYRTVTCNRSIAH